MRYKLLGITGVFLVVFIGEVTGGQSDDYLAEEVTNCAGRSTYSLRIDRMACDSELADSEGYPLSPNMNCGNLVKNVEEWNRLLETHNIIDIPGCNLRSLKSELSQAALTLMKANRNGWREY